MIPFSQVDKQSNPDSYSHTTNVQCINANDVNCDMVQESQNIDVKAKCIP